MATSDRAPGPTAPPIRELIAELARTEDALRAEAGQQLAQSALALHLVGAATEQVDLFRGEIRATGEVLVDMMPLLQRTGIDAVVLRGDQNQASAERALSFFEQGHYQGDALDHHPLFARQAT